MIFGNSHDHNFIFETANGLVEENSLKEFIILFILNKFMITI